MTQSDALTILKTGANVFLTGEPGAGKTYVLNQYIEYLKDHAISVAITASTGIAATHIGGVTIHSWTGMGVKKNLTPQELDALEGKQYLWKRFDTTKVLIIDEISMLSAEQFDTVDQICRAFKRNQKPFGGMQIIAVGDFFQLPPITKGEEVQKFAFESQAWKEAKLLVCYIKEQWRQEDGSLLSILKSIRKGDVEEGFPELEERLEATFEDIIRPTRLYTHNADVDQINLEELDKLGTELAVYGMQGKGKDDLVEKLKESCLSPETLYLKPGAIVMCTKNNFEVGYVNGTLGEVVEISKETGYPTIITNHGKTITIEPTTWSIDDGDKVLAQIEQVPLRLAWAITVHKSQGMSLDAVELDLSRAFEYGQGYVALSRARSLSGLKLLGFHGNALMVHPKVLHVDTIFHRQSEQMEDYLHSKTSEELLERQNQFILLCSGSLEKVERKEKESFVSTYEKTRALLQDKQSIVAIARERELTQETVISHIEKLLETGVIGVEDILYLKPKTKKFKETLATFQDYFDETKETNLSPIKDKLGSDASYFDIRLARLFLEK